MEQVRESLAYMLLPTLIPFILDRAYIIALIIVSVLMLVSFAYAEKKVKQPIMPLYLWRTPNFAATWLVGFLVYCFWGTVVLYIVL